MDYHRYQKHCALRRQTLLSLIAAALLVLTGCVSGPAVYVVAEDDTLYSIAWKYEIDWHRLARWNNLGPPYRIYPGQKLILTKPENGTFISSASSQSGGDSADANGASRDDVMASSGRFPDNQSNKARSASGGEPSSAHRSDSVYDTGSTEWVWPVAGSDIDDGHGVTKSRKGVDIHGDIGVPVRAASAGHVVYSGSGLEGYGNLLIIKHAGNYLSAYGFNSRLLVAEGDQVSAGDKIAEMGMGPGQTPMLHFEIRHDGQPLAVNRILPKSR